MVAKTNPVQIRSKANDGKAQDGVWGSPRLLVEWTLEGLGGEFAE